MRTPADMERLNRITTTALRGIEATKATCDTPAANALASQIVDLFNKAIRQGGMQNGEFIFALAKGSANIVCGLVASMPCSKELTAEDEAAMVQIMLSGLTQSAMHSVLQRHIKDAVHSGGLN